MSLEVTEAIGLLSLTVRAQDVALSSLPTHSCCHVEWAETDATAARSTIADFILMKILQRRSFEKQKDDRSEYMRRTANKTLLDSFQYLSYLHSQHVHWTPI